MLLYLEAVPPNVVFSNIVEGDLCFVCNMSYAVFYYDVVLLDI
jgi:hypothetical protein